MHDTVVAVVVPRRKGQNNAAVRYIVVLVLAAGFLFLATVTTQTTVTVSSSSFLFDKNSIDFKPATRIPERTCHRDAVPSQRHQRQHQHPRPVRIESFRNYKHYKNLTELTTTRGGTETPLAVCKIYHPEQQRRHEFRSHFPHAMQLLYMCYTHWRNNPSRVPVLMHPYEIQDGTNGSNSNSNFRSNAFLRGFLELVESQMKVEVLTGEEIQEWLRNNNNTSSTNSSSSIDFETTELRRPVGYVLSHVEKLNEMVERHFAFETTTSGEAAAGATNTTATQRSSSTSTNNNNDDDDDDHSTTATTTTVCRLPRIGILNRKPSSARSILNAEEVVRAIVSGVFEGNATAAARASSLLSSPPPVSLYYFEGRDFREQVRFFRGTDLLISPHGAQLTGIPFLASSKNNNNNNNKNKSCTRLLEIFHHDYLLPDYFGTLALDSNIEYSYYVVPDADGYRYRLSNDNDNETNKTKHQQWAEKEMIATKIEGRVVNKDRATKAKSKNFCLDPKPIVDAVKDSIRDWCECKNKHQQIEQ